jgi:hypothetical protein
MILCRILTPAGKARNQLKNRFVVQKEIWKGVGRMFDIYVGTDGLFKAQDYTSVILADGQSLSERIAQVHRDFGVGGEGAVI